MSGISSREQKSIDVGVNKYLITAFEATYGLDAMGKVQAFGENGGTPPVEFVKEVLTKYVTVNNIQLTSKLFDTHFSRKYNEMFEVFRAVLDFNYGTEEGPNVESDTDE